jgi:hypothetical protein
LISPFLGRVCPIKHYHQFDAASGGCEQGKVPLQAQEYSLMNDDEEKFWRLRRTVDQLVEAVSYIAGFGAAAFAYYVLGTWGWPDWVKLIGAIVILLVSFTLVKKQIDPWAD